MMVVLLGQVKSTEDDVFLLVFVLSASRLFASARLFFVGRSGETSVLLSRHTTDRR